MKNIIRQRFNFSDEHIQLRWIGGLFIVLTILHMTGALEGIEWINGHITDVIIMLVAFGFLVISNLIVNTRRNILHEISSLSSEALGVNANKFKDVGEAYLYIVEKLKNASSLIEDVTWGSYEGYRNTKEQDAYEEYVNTMKDVIKNDITYKEISSLSTKHYYERANSLIKFASYHLGYIDLSTITIPLMSFIIIDSREVVIGFVKVEGVIQPSNDIIYISITEPNIVGFYKSYYNDLWNNSKKIKESSKINNQLLQKIEERIIKGN